jgi:hypothetical protein
MSDNDSTTERLSAQTTTVKLSAGQPVFWRPEPHIPFRIYAVVMRVHRRHAVIRVPAGALDNKTMLKRVKRSTLEPREWCETEEQS